VTMMPGDTLFDPDMAVIMTKLRALQVVDPRTLPIEEARAQFTRNQLPWVWSPFEMAEVREVSIPGAAGAVPARLYLPKQTGSLPVILFIHGGGWTFGSVETHDGSMRILAGLSGCAVLGIDYRLAPDHPFPAPLDDAMSALAFIESGRLGPSCDPSRIVLSGDSAGANLALGTLIARRDAGGLMPATALLFYGCYGPVFETESHKKFGDGSFGLTTEGMRWFWRNYLGDLPPEKATAACAPLYADLTGLPPLYLNAAGLDPLLDDTLILSQRLAAAGIPFNLDVWPGVIHGFHRLASELPIAMKAMTAAARYLDRHFSQ
jgi:acetyl esterase